MMRMKRGICFCLIGMLLFAVCSCKKENDTISDGSEDQAYFGHGSTINISSDEEYYYTAVNGLIEAASKDSLEFHVICNKPDCFHNDTSCTAFLGHGGVWVSDGQLFALKTNENAAKETLDLDLIKVSVRDNVAEKIATLLHVQGDSWSVTYPTEFMVHKGYAYYVIDSGTDSGKAKSMVYRVKLEENSNPEVILELSDDLFALNKLIGEEEMVYILSMHLEDEHAVSVDTTLYEYSISDGTLTHVNDADGINMRCFYVRNQDLVYEASSEWEIHCLSLETGEDCLIVPALDCELSGIVYANDSYIFDWRFNRYSASGVSDSEEPYAVRVYTYEGEQIAEIELPVQDAAFAGYPLGADEKYMFFYQDEYEEDEKTGNTNQICHIWTYDMANLEGGQWEDHIIK